MYAESLTQSDRFDDALESLEIMFELPGAYSAVFVEGSPPLDLLRELPRYALILERYQQQDH